MERCEPCTEKRHAECEVLAPHCESWCECPCHTGEKADPLGAFLADVAVIKGGLITLLLSDENTT